MKTTIEIDDALLRDAKRLGVERNLTLKAIFDSALRQYLVQAHVPPERPFKLRKRPIKGRGLQPGLDWHDWDRIRALAYEGRGG